MATIHGSTGPLVGVTTLSWPAGTTADMWAVVFNDTHGDESSRPGDGWEPVIHKTWKKKLTATDIASPLPVTGTHAEMTVFANSGGIGAGRWSSSVNLKANGCGLWFGYIGPHYSGALASATYQRGSTITDPSDNWRHGMWARAVTTAGTYDPGSAHRQATWLSVEVLPLGAPLSPVWETVSGAQVDRTQPVPLRLGHRSSGTSPIDRLKVEIRVAGGSWQHLSATGTLVGSAQELVTDSGLVSVAANVLANNTSYEVRGYTHDEGGWSPLSGTLTLAARTPGTLVVTLTTAHGDLTPTASWVLTPGVGSQRSYEVRIALAGQGWANPIEGWTSGLLTGAGTTWTAPATNKVPNGASVVAWVVATDDALPSAPTASSAQTVSWTAPAAPSGITAHDTRPFSATAAGVPAAAEALEWEWETPEGWATVATTEDPDASETIALPLAPYAVARRYRIRALHLSEGVRLASDWVTSTAVASTDPGAYFVSIDGTEWLAVDVYDDGGRELAQGVLTSWAIGATVAHRQMTLPAGWVGSSSIDVDTEEDHDALVEWITTRPRWVVRWFAEQAPDGTMRGRKNTIMGLYARPGSARWDQLAITERNVSFAWVTQ